MNPAFSMTTIYIANALGFVLALVLLCGNSWLLRNNGREGKCIRHMLIITMISCVADPVAYRFDGTPGTFWLIVVYASNFWLQVSSLAIGVLWLRFFAVHINTPRPAIPHTIVTAACALGVILMLVNCFYPIVFFVNDENVYSRGPLFWLNTGLEITMICCSLIMYYRARRRGEILMFLSVWQVLLPMCCGILIQALFYGVSAQYPFMTISIYSIINCLQNEAVYRDSLTGIFNKAFMDNIERRYIKETQCKFTVFMMDVNDFKSINDRFGHLVGNQALAAFAEALHESVGSMGNAIRYAGDEFIVLLNTRRQVEIDAFIETVQKKLQVISDDPSTPYTLSTAIGYHSFDPEHQTFDELLDEVDKRMYVDKDRFYAEHPQILRRK